MGFFSKIWKKAKKTVRKPLSKMFKGVAKGIAKVGKAVMRGVNYMNKKLGPLGSIALAMAMPYALGGLSTMTTGLMQTQGTGTWATFLRSAGQVGNQIRLGYQATTGAISDAFGSITNSIAKTFTKFAGEGTKVGNYWKKISTGAKNLYKSAQRNFAKTFGKKAMAGSVDVTGIHARGPASWNNAFINQSMTTNQAAEALRLGVIDGSQLTGQSLGSKSGWWTQELSKAQLNNQELITNTINEAWNNSHQLSKNALKYKNDLVTHAKDIGSYINDEQIGDIMLNNGTTSNELLTGKNYLDVDLAKTGDYTLGTARDRFEGTYNFTGDKSFNTQIAKDSKKGISKKLKSYALSKADSLLATKMPEHPVVYEVDTGSQNLYTDSSTKYSGTDIKGSAGGELFAAVFGKNNANNISTYYKNMNILAG